LDHLEILGCNNQDMMKKLVCWRSDRSLKNQTPMRAKGVISKWLISLLPVKLAVFS